MLSLDALPIEKALELNARLQTKKQALRKALAANPPIKDKTNDFDKYSYISEAEYKRLFTDLLTAHGLELTASCEETDQIETKHGKMPCGRIAHWLFRLTDTETGFFEESYVSGEGWDKGDKGIYKAHTGAMKYFFANTFLVAAGDEAESESVDFVPATKWATREQIEYLARVYKGQNMNRLLQENRINDLSQLTAARAEELIRTIQARKGK